MAPVATILGCAADGWTPGVGDPTVGGWLTLAAYLATAGLAAAAASDPARFPPATAGRERLFWAAAALALVLLGVNKELDLQTALRAAGRCASLAGGWYDARVAVKTAFLAVLGSAVLATATGVVLLLRGALARNGLALAGLGLIAAYVIVRATAFQKLEALAGAGLGAVPMVWLLEIGGIALVALAAGGVLRAGRRARPLAGG